MHGIGGTRRIWDPVVAPLAADHEVIAVDLPGFGESAPLADGVTPDPATLARTLGALLDARGIATAHLAGSSLGAWIALELARQGRARSVTSLCAAGFWSQPLLGDDYLTSGSFISFPLVFHDQLVGVVNLTNRAQRGLFVEEDVERVRMLGLVISLIASEAQLPERLLGTIREQ